MTEPTSEWEKVTKNGLIFLSMLAGIMVAIIFYKFILNSQGGKFPKENYK